MPTQDREYIEPVREDTKQTVTGRHRGIRFGPGRIDRAWPLASSIGNPQATAGTDMFFESAAPEFPVGSKYASEAQAAVLHRVAVIKFLKCHFSADERRKIGAELGDLVNRSG